MSLDEALQRISVDQLHEYHYEVLGIPKNDDGLIAYFHKESHALAFRLMIINNLLNLQ